MPPLNKGQFEAAFDRSKARLSDEELTEKDPLQELWVLIEPHLEEKGHFQTEVRDHLLEVTKDIRSWRHARNWAFIFAIFIVMLVTATLGVILFIPNSPVKLQTLPSDSVRIALLAGPFAVMFGLTAIILRGAFASPRREETAMPIPESAKLLTEAFASILHKG